mgnify:CR=1 FL=1
MNVDKAYLLGLVVGGGIFGDNEDVFRIRLPYKQWGSIEEHPERAGQISKDIMRVVSPMFRNTYGITIQFETFNFGRWDILCEGDILSLKSDLEKYDISCEGEIKKNVSIDKITKDLIDDNLKKRFIAGLADTIGSTKSTHRRFSDQKQVLSFEISGFQFKFVCSLCRLLYSIGCYPDQILWNHPNFHSGNDPYNKTWKKGFKLRVLLDQYEEFGAFAFTSKAKSAKENIALQESKNIALPCENKDISVRTSCIHSDENSETLPEYIRGGHYIHYGHVCAVLKCPHAPYEKIDKYLAQAEKYINPFPILFKDKKEKVESIINENVFYKNRNYKKIQLNVSEIYSKYKKSAPSLIFGESDSGYPLNVIMQAITFLIAANKDMLHGKRPIGHQDTIIQDELKNNPNLTISALLPEILTPLIITSGDYSVMVGAQNPKLYKKLISFDQNNPYKMVIRPITEEDFA